ncbi:MAG: hypothetical protein AAGC99_08685 [Pseudomonadota bacterium]
MSPSTEAQKAARAERLAAEMRKNLVKRKRQQREMTENAERDGADESQRDEPS